MQKSFHQVIPVRFFQFALVGASGLVVNALVLALATEGLNIYYLWSAAIATVASTSWNFTFTELWAFRDRRLAGGWPKRFAQFALMNSASFLLRAPVFWTLTSVVGLHYQASNVVSIGLVTLIRYLLANQWIWRRVAVEVQTYNIHDIVTIVSAAPLPELEPFRTANPIEQPTIRIRVGRINTDEKTPPGVRRLDYDEGLGPLGFRARIDITDHIEIITSHLLNWSPHVLYTNLVEPVLRWTFVEKGYALVHGACLASGGRAVLITALTDTGKTTTLLQILRRQNSDPSIAFISDDLTLVDQNGRVLNYPKPLTISAHTVRAIQANCLTWYERFFLPLQSRIHSKQGRWIAHAIGRTSLPAATINACAQYLVPPPKYTIEQLVPHTGIAREAQLTTMFVIERAEDVCRQLPAEEALKTLMRNCEDAYGFPPYADIEAFLKQSSVHGDMGLRECEIVAGALRDVRTLLIRHLRGDWWPQVLAGIHEPQLNVAVSR